MFTTHIPGFDDLKLEHMVMDYNGTIACDGEILDHVKELVEILSTSFAIHVVTADTFGKAKERVQGLPVTLSVLGSERQNEQKREYIETLGPDSCVCIGNGRNDALMLERAKIGIALVQTEGAAACSINSADILCPDIRSALELFVRPKRLTATLRS
jgi:P-type E1-E2 ATPase